jgi:hypothetical protein
MTTEIRYLAQQLLHAGLAPLSERDARVIARVAKRVHIARDVNKVFDQRLTFGQRLADQVAAVGGSWGFITGFGVFLAIWVVLVRQPSGIAGLLERRLTALGLDPEDIRKLSPLLLLDLRWTCSCCTEKKRCADDFAEDPNPPDWESYCPNAGRLRTLT